MRGRSDMQGGEVSDDGAIASSSGERHSMGGQPGRSKAVSSRMCPKGGGRMRGNKIFLSPACGHRRFFLPRRAQASFGSRRLRRFFKAVCASSWVHIQGCGGASERGDSDLCA